MKHVTITVLLVACYSIGTALIIGCGEETEDPVTMEGVSGTLGVLKIPDAAPGAPQLIPEGTPTVKSVGYYSDWQTTKKLTGTVSPGKTIFIKIEFSEGMKLVIADDKWARPILYHKIGKELTRFRIVDYGARGEDFASGDAKPVKNKRTYLCKYVVQPKDSGTFVAAVGKWSIDLDGNLLPAFYTHKEQLLVGTTVPSVKSVDYYSDWQLRKPIADTVAPGATVYTKIVFSEPMQVKAADDTSARPILYHQLNGRRTRFRIKQSGGLKSGDAKVWGKNDSDVFIARYQIPKNADGTFTVAVGKWSADKDGDTLAAFYTHQEQLRVSRPTGPEPIEKTALPDTVAPTPQRVVLGSDLIGHYTLANIPSEIQSLFSILNIHDNIEIVVHGGASGIRLYGGEEDLLGLYQYPIAHAYSANTLRRWVVLSFIAEELFHAHQHTVAGSTRAWKETPEGVAYIEAQRKDLAEKGPILTYDKLDGPPRESAATIFALYWSLHYIGGPDVERSIEYIKVDTPNRYQWVEEWFGQ